MTAKEKHAYQVPMDSNPLIWLVVEKYPGISRDAAALRAAGRIDGRAAGGGLAAAKLLDPGGSALP
ncbi:MAG TPA: hypothetical protein VIO83_03380, partial [Pseudomonas sp.]